MLVEHMTVSIYQIKFEATKLENKLLYWLSDHKCVVTHSTNHCNSTHTHEQRLQQALYSLCYGV